MTSLRIPYPIATQLVEPIMAKQPTKKAEDKPAETKPERTDDEIRLSAQAGEIRQLKSELAQARAQATQLLEQRDHARKCLTSVESEAQSLREARASRYVSVLALTRDAMIGDVPAAVNTPVAQVELLGGATLAWLGDAIVAVKVTAKA